MKELNQYEISTVSGGLTNLETVLSTGIVGSAVGALGGAYLLGSSAGYGYGAVIASFFGSIAGFAGGGAIGMGAGLLLGSVFVAAQETFHWYQGTPNDADLN